MIDPYNKIVTYTAKITGTKTEKEKKTPKMTLVFTKKDPETR